MRPAGLVSSAAAASYLPMRYSFESLAYHAAAAAGAAARTVGLGRCDVSVLIYHSISEGDGAVTVPPRLFQEQIRWLCDRYEILSLDEALKRPAGERPVVVLTFDDGYEDYLRSAVPFLLELGVPSTVYVITSLLAADAGRYPFVSGRDMRPLSTDQVEQLGREELVTIGSHGHRHRRLVGQSASVLEEELGTSCAVLSELLGRPDFHYAFPWGTGDRRARGAVRRHFRSAAFAGSRGNPAPLDPFRIFRMPVKREGLRLFAHRVRGDLMLEGMARSLRDRWVGGSRGEPN